MLRDKNLLLNSNGNITKKTQVKKIKHENHTLGPDKQSALSGIIKRINSKKRYSGHVHWEECLKIRISSQIILSVLDHKQRKS